MKIARDVKHGEEGQILILALLFLTVVAVMVTALLGQADGSFGATAALRKTVGVQYAADGAMQDAMTALAQPGNLSFITSTSSCTSACPATACPNLASSTSNPLAMNNASISTNCTYIPSSAHLPGVRGVPVTYEIDACVTGASCASPLLRAQVTISHFSPPQPALVTMNYWSTLDGTGS